MYAGHTDYFAGCQTVQEIKKLYRTLAMENHPDRGGSTQIMQEINRQYKIALQRCHQQTHTDPSPVGTCPQTEQQHTYYYNDAREQAIIDFIDRLIHSGALQPDVDAYLVGTWIWISGNTRPVKELLKAIGCRWHNKRAAWYWHAPDQRSFYNANIGLDGIAAAYGASKISSPDEEAKRKQL